MTTQEKLIKRKLSLLELADFLNNVSLKPVGSTAAHVNTSMTSKKPMKSMVLRG